MSSRRHYLISYDIGSKPATSGTATGADQVSLRAADKRRTQVHDTLLTRGDRAQFSVFFCQLTPRELAELKHDLIALIHHEVDQILIVDLGPSHNPLSDDIDYLGRLFEVASRVMIV